MRKLTIEMVAPFDVDEALHCPENFVDEGQDIVLLKIHDPKYPGNPTLFMLGKGDTGHYICVEDNDVCTYHNVCDAFPLPELYADLLKRHTTGDVDERLFDLYNRVEDVLELTADENECSSEMLEVYVSLRRLKQALEDAGYASVEVSFDE